VDALSLETTDHADEASLTEIFSLAPGSTRFLIESMGSTEGPTGWHRTNTIDYEYIIAGRIDLLMEDGSAVTLEAGDVNIQLGGTHQWWNHYGEPCVIAIIMVGVPSEEIPGVKAATDPG
jgi:quercetin dioxygenase-like cupin family protein